MTAPERAQMGVRGIEYCHREFGRDMLISRVEGLLFELVVPTSGRELPIS